MTLFFAQAAPAISRSELRWEFATIAAAVALFTVAVAAIALFFFRRKTRDLTLIYFALSCIPYAVRLLTDLPFFRLLFHQSETFWRHLNWDINGAILIPFGLFFYQVSPPYLKKIFQWVLGAQALFAIFAIVAPALGITFATLNVANDVAVLALCAFLVLCIIIARLRAGPHERMTHEMRVFVTGFLVWFLFIIHANLLGLGIVSGHNVEFVGFLVFVACLAYISAYRIFANEERLSALAKELEIARRIQSSILPQALPLLAGLDITARYLPMSAVAGDFYDFLLLDEKRLGVLVADVTGHGIPAALIASMLKVAFAGQVAHAREPHRVLSGLNHALCGKFEEHFVTAAYLFIDLEAGLLRYSAAGHPPLMLAGRASGNVREIEQNGLMLGFFPDATYSSVQISIAPGTRCLLYTDGLFEARNAALEEFGMSRCKEFLQTQRDLPAAQFATQLLDRIAAFSGHAARNNSRPASSRSDDLSCQNLDGQQDDITLIVLDFWPRSASAA